MGSTPAAFAVFRGLLRPMEGIFNGLPGVIYNEGSIFLHTFPVICCTVFSAGSGNCLEFPLSNRSRCFFPFLQPVVPIPGRSTRGACRE
jgi:hypothetical protein